MKIKFYNMWSGFRGQLNLSLAVELASINWEFLGPALYVSGIYVFEAQWDRKGQQFNFTVLNFTVSFVWYKSR